jgi:ADP-heptose:LPS heptosyltransferase
MSADFELRARGDDVTWLIARGLSFIPQQAQPPRAFYQVDLSFRWLRLLELMRWLKKQAFENVIIFHAPSWIYIAIWLAGIPVRTGRKSQWYSFLTLNKGIRQSRKSGERSELFYNSQLVRKSLLADAKGTEKNHFLRLRPFLNKSELAALGISVPYVVIHPGMSGSARNWTVQHFIDLAKSLSDDFQIIITGTNADREYWRPVHQALGGQSLCLAEQLSAQDLVGVLAYASLVVAPSTGVVHKVLSN